MPHVGIQGIKFDDLGRMAFDLSNFLFKSFDPLGDRHMAKPPKAYQWTQSPSPSNYRVNAKRRLPGVAVSDLGGNGKKILTCFALAPLTAFVGPAFDFVRTGTSRPIQHRHH